MLFDRFFYPSPPPLPLPVEEPIETVLARLEASLRERAPGVAASLQPGLTPERLSELEARLGFRLTDELRALYRWRSGTAPGASQEFIPGHRFLPLEEAVEQLLALRRQVAGGTLVQRVVYRVTAGYRTSWLTILDDGSGDGYFFDPKRQRAGAPVLYHFAEDGEYLFFPSLKNLIAGITECFEQGIYSATGERGMTEDYERSARLWQRFGARPSGREPS